MAKKLGFTVAAAATLMMMSTASATEGYFAHGYGARQSAMAGAGVADANDAMAGALNPAGTVGSGDQFAVSLSLFNPNRSFTVSGDPGFLPDGTTESGSNWHGIPGFGYVRQLSDRSAFSITAYGNGGMNTSYPNVSRSVPECGGGSGIFCGGAAGVDLMQLFVAVGYARNITDNFSVGVAPILAMQMFEARGLAAFTGLSVDPAHVTNNEHDKSFGYGVRVGAEWSLADNFRLGGSYQSVVKMGEFDDYAGLFEGGGSFDIPSSYQLGLAFDVMGMITVAADYRRINYTDVDAVANPFFPAPLGSNGGPGFGWDDVDAFKIGVEMDMNPSLTARLGVGWNNNPIGSDDVTLNVLAPGVMEQHYTAGFSYNASRSNALDFAIMYAPEATVNGIEVTPGGPNPGRNIELAMDQLQITFGWTHTFGY